MGSLCPKARKAAAIPDNVGPSAVDFSCLQFVPVANRIDVVNCDEILGACRIGIQLGWKAGIAQESNQGGVHQFFLKPGIAPAFASKNEPFLSTGYYAAAMKLSCKLLESLMSVGYTVCTSVALSRVDTCCTWFIAKAPAPQSGPILAVSMYSNEWLVLVEHVHPYIKSAFKDAVDEGWIENAETDVEDKEEYFAIKVAGDAWLCRSDGGKAPNAAASGASPAGNPNVPNAAAIFGGGKQADEAEEPNVDFALMKASIGRNIGSLMGSFADLGSVQKGDEWRAECKAHAILLKLVEAFDENHVQFVTTANLNGTADTMLFQIRSEDNHNAKEHGFGLFALQSTDVVRLVNVHKDAVDAVHDVLKNNWSGTPEVVKSGNVLSEFRLPAHPWRSGGDTANNARSLVCTVLDTLAANGWATHCALKVYNDDEASSTFVLKTCKCDAELRHCAVATEEESNVKLINADADDSFVVQEALTKHYSFGAQSLGSTGPKRHGWSLMGGPWNPDHNSKDAADSVRLTHASLALCHALHGMRQAGWRPLAGVEVASELCEASVSPSKSNHFMKLASDWSTRQNKVGAAEAPAQCMRDAQSILLTKGTPEPQPPTAVSVVAVPPTPSPEPEGEQTDAEAEGEGGLKPPEDADEEDEDEGPAEAPAEPPPQAEKSEESNDKPDSRPVSYSDTVSNHEDLMQMPPIV